MNGPIYLTYLSDDDLCPLPSAAWVSSSAEEEVDTVDRRKYLFLVAALKHSQKISEQKILQNIEIEIW